MRDVLDRTVPTLYSAALFTIGVGKSIWNRQSQLQQVLANPKMPGLNSLLLELGEKIQAEGIVKCAEGTVLLPVGVVALVSTLIASGIFAGLHSDNKGFFKTYVISGLLTVACGVATPLALGYGGYKLGEGVADIAQAVLTNAGIQTYLPSLAR